MRRWEVAGYLNRANALAGDISRSARAGKVSGALRRADRAAKDALDAFYSWHYLRAVRKAREAYVVLTAAANDIGVTSASLAAARTPLPGMQPVREVCRPRLLQELLQRGQ